MRRVRLTAAAVMGAALLSGCGKKAPEPPPPPPVSVASPLARTVVDWDEYVGRFEAVEAVEVRPRVTGYLQGAHFTDGQMVRKGQLLFTLDPRPFQATLDQARAQEARAEAALANARSQAARAETLLAARAVSQQEFEALQAAARSAAADLAAAKAAVQAQALTLSFTRVTAPISGRVSQRRVDPGNSVLADNTVLTTLVSVSPIHFAFEGSEALLLKYQRQKAGAQPGTPVFVRLQDEADYRHPGRLDFVDNSLDAGVGTIAGRAVIDNGDGFLKPGMFGHMRLKGSNSYQALLVPETAVVTDGPRKLVLVVDAKNIVSGRPVEMGPAVGDMRVIRAGLNAQDRVIVGGQMRARPGQPVTPRETRLTPPKVTAADLPTASSPPAGLATLADR